MLLGALAPRTGGPIMPPLMPPQPAWKEPRQEAAKPVEPSAASGASGETPAETPKPETTE